MNGLGVNSNAQVVFTGAAGGSAAAFDAPLSGHGAFVLIASPAGQPIASWFPATDPYYGQNIVAASA